MSDAEDAFGFEAALRAIEASDPRWRAPDSGTGDLRFDRAELERFAHSIAFVLDACPAWTETVVFPGVADMSETEVRVLTERALVVASIPWTSGGTPPEPVLKVRPLRLLRELDVDGFEYDSDGRPTGCTITLLFEHGPGVRLGASEGADRGELARLLPSLQRALDV